MAVSFSDLSSAAGLKRLDEHLLSRSYISGYQASKDDLTVHAALSKPPSSENVNVSRWYNHIEALLRISGVSAEGSGVTIKGFAPVAEAVATPPVVDGKASLAEDEDDDDVDLFGEETEEEKKAAEERATAVKSSTKKKESGKSSVLLDVKPWDDETDMKKLEEAVRSVQMDGLLWGASKLIPVGYGIKKLQVMMTIVDDLVSVDTLIEERLTVEPINEYVQSCDIAAFNKILSFLGLPMGVGFYKNILFFNTTLLAKATFGEFSPCLRGKPKPSDSRTWNCWLSSKNTLLQGLRKQNGNGNANKIRFGLWLPVNSNLSCLLEENVVVVGDIMTEDGLPGIMILF